MKDEPTLKPTSHQVGMSLEGMSAAELDERLVMLFDEMRRVKQALEVQRPAGIEKGAKQNNVFKTAFPMLSKPEAGK
ncbi:DUF1192 family protein [Maritalea sp.]|jgi:uncharacterized small protein (DUF1192 family)|uniref:DUF1192 family protein n=1 Tax=Maritalea sp. TaxID=2003361 RepID=UPI0039E5A6DD